MVRMAAQKRVVSIETRNRILIWQAVLKTGYEAMLADDLIWQWLVERIQDNNSSVNYAIGNLQSTVYVPAAAHSAVQVEAVILFYQVFADGKAGPGIAGNHDPEVVTLRNEMVAFAKATLGWDDAKYDGIMNSIKDRRHKLTAHYDGGAAEFDEPIPGVVQRMRMPGVNFPMNQERTDFISLIRVTYEFVQTDLLPSF